MNENTCKNTPSRQEIQNSELNEEQLAEAVGGIGLTAVMPIHHSRRCAANPDHVYYPLNPDDVCPFCGAKDFIDFRCK